MHNVQAAAFINKRRFPMNKIKSISKILLILIIGAIGVQTIGCSSNDDDKIRDEINKAVYEVVLDSVAKGPVSSSAMLYATISDASKSVKEKGFCYSSSDSIPTKDVGKAFCQSVEGDFKLAIHSLVDGIKYYAWAYIEDGEGVKFSNVWRFDLSSVWGERELAVVLDSIEIIFSETGVRFYATIISISESIEQKGVCHSWKNNLPSLNDIESYCRYNYSKGERNFSIEITDSSLKTGKNYARAFIVNSDGTTEYSNVKEFEIDCLDERWQINAYLSRWSDDIYTDFCYVPKSGDGPTYLDNWLSNLCPSGWNFASYADYWQDALILINRCYDEKLIDKLTNSSKGPWWLGGWSGTDENSSFYTGSLKNFNEGIREETRWAFDESAELVNNCGGPIKYRCVKDN